MHLTLGEGTCCFLEQIKKAFLRKLFCLQQLVDTLLDRGTLQVQKLLLVLLSYAANTRVRLIIGFQ